MRLGCFQLSADSTDPKHIEVKGRVKGADTITVTRNEILYAFNQGEKFVLAIVFMSPTTAPKGLTPSLTRFSANPIRARRVSTTISQSC
ncbi:MAG: DUF3883 domain-containing protein [Gemmataceae bacterium]